MQRWLDRDGEGWKDRKGRGRKRATTLREDKQLVSRYKTHWRKKSRGRRAIGKELASECSNMPPISGDTVYRRLEEAGGKMRTIKKRFPLIQRHRINRVRFAKEFKNEDFTKWLWSDETTFEIGSRKSKAFQFPGEALEEVSYKYPTSQMVWSCISSDGPGEIAFIDGTVNAQKYLVILENHLSKAAKKLFREEEWKVHSFIYYTPF